MKNKLFNILLLIVLSLGSYAFIVDLSERSDEEVLSETVDKINVINYYINDFILLNGRVPTFWPNNEIIGAYSNVGITNVWWPTTIGNNFSQVDFVVDTTNFQITYQNIFRSTIASNDPIRGRLSTNPSLPIDAFVDTSNNTNLIIPFNIKTIEFQAEINNNLDTMRSSIETSSSIHLLVARSDLGSYCSDSSRNNKPFFIPDGVGWYSVATCENTGVMTEFFNNEDNDEIRNNLASTKGIQTGHFVYDTSGVGNIIKNVWDGTNWKVVQ